MWAQSNYGVIAWCTGLLHSDLCLPWQSARQWIRYYSADRFSIFEIKLGLGAADEAAKNLKRLADKIDTKKVNKPATLTVITGNGFAHQRKDGVNVVPLALLGP